MNKMNKTGSSQDKQATTNGGSEFSNQARKLCVLSRKVLQVSQQTLLIVINEFTYTYGAIYMIKKETEKISEFISGTYNKTLN